MSVPLWPLKVLDQLDLSDVWCQIPRILQKLLQTASHETLLSADIEPTASIICQRNPRAAGT